MSGNSLGSSYDERSAANRQEQALRELLGVASHMQSFLADVRQAMWKPAFEEGQEWAREWHHRAQALADGLAVAEEQASAALAGREPDPFAGSLHDAR